MRKVSRDRLLLHGGQEVDRRDFEASHPWPALYTTDQLPIGTYEFDDPAADLVIRRCRFAMFQHPAQRELSERPTLRRVHVERCHFAACELGPVVVEDSVIDTIWVHRGKWGPQAIAGCAFKHVVIRGRITGSIAFLPSTRARLGPVSAMAVDPFVEANSRYYQGVDWALDIGEAEFTELELYWSGIPAHLVRRDPETQVVVSRTSTQRGDWRAACGDSAQWVAIERFLDAGFADTVLVAGRRSKRLSEDLDAFRRLRDIGVVIG